MTDTVVIPVSHPPELGGAEGLEIRLEEPDLRSHLPKRLRLGDEERSTLAEIGKRVGRKLLDQIAVVAKPDTILPRIGGWWPRSSMVRKVAPVQVGRRSRLR
jgi:hypothetical protein